MKKGDMNAAVNPKAKKVLEWEATEKIIIANDKDKPTRVPGRKEDQAICLDLAIITPDLSDKVKNLNLDTLREWPPAKVTGEQDARPWESSLWYTRGVVKI